MKKVALHNLGCKVNSYETEVMQEKLEEAGFQIVGFNEEADIYIINTCTVTNMADRKSRQMLHRAKQKNPQAIVVAVGCYVQTGLGDIEQDAAIDLAIGNNQKKNVVEILQTYLTQRAEVHAPCEASQTQCIKNDESVINVSKTLGDTTVLDITHTYEYEEMQLTQTAEHTRAYIKIQDGCNQFCSYCAIPLARGRVRSRDKADIIREIQGLVASGYKEVVLTGIHISSYGVDFEEESWQQGICRKLTKEQQPRYTGQSKLIDLTEEICQIEGLKRVRLGSLEPRVVTEETAERLSKLSKLCPHFHLSLQSGCDATLKRMNRKYTSEEYFRSVEALRKFFDHPAITTDVIVGFPGETEEEYAQTVAFLEKIRFFEMHIFKYSKRANTNAATMPGQVPEQVKTQRSNVLQEMEERQSKEYRAQYIGKEVEVLLEEEKSVNGCTYFLGHTPNYVKAAIPAGAWKEATPMTVQKLEANTFVKVTPTGFLTEEILTL